MKRRFPAVALALALCLLLAPCAFASNRVSNIDIDVMLYRDGSALVTQTWRGRFTEGTECYIPIRDSGYLDVYGLTISSDESEYETLDDWDVDASFEEKSERCGIRRTGNGFEICWGITDYGDRTYTVSYTVENLVRSFDEADGFNFMFVNRDMNITPTDVTVWIEAESDLLSVDNSAAWAFGFDGQIEFEQGGVYAWTDTPLSDSDSVIIMLEMNPGILVPEMRVDGTFEENVKDPAMNGSDYGDDDLTGGEIVSIIAATVGGILVIAGIAIIRQKKRQKKMAEICARHGALDALPADGNLPASWELGRLFGIVSEEGAVIGAMLMRLLRDGCLVPEENGADGDPLDKTPLYFDHAPQHAGSPEAWLYDCLLLAADEDGLLTAKSAKRYFRNNPEDMRHLVERCEQTGKYWLEDAGCFNGAPCGSFKRLTENGERELARLLLVKRLLTDENAEAPSVPLAPEDCYAYALLFDLKDKTLAQIRRFYPEMDTDWNELDSFYWYSMYYYDYSYGEMHRVEEERRSEGSGGSSSSSGGGGFSGGGSGGGTR